MSDSYDDYEAKMQLVEQPVQEPVGDEWTPCMKLPVVVHVRQQRHGESHVSTREGITPVKPDDLIMRGVSGEEYPIGRAIFEQTYSLDIAPSLPVQEQQQVGPVEDMLLRRAVLRSAKIVSDGRFVTKQAALEQPPLPVQEPVAWVTVEGGVWVSTRSADFRHIADGQYQLYAGPLQNDVFAAISTLKAIGYVYDNGKFCKEGEQWIAPTASQPPLPVQPEPLEYWNAVEGWVKIESQGELK